MLSKIKGNKERAVLLSIKLIFLVIFLTFLYFTLGELVDEIIYEKFCDDPGPVYLEDSSLSTLVTYICLVPQLFFLIFYIVLLLFSLLSAILGLLSFKSKKRKYAIGVFLLGTLFFLFYIVLVVSTLWLFF